MSSKGGLLVGKSHKAGGIPMVVNSTGQKVELEGNEVIINKLNATNDSDRFKVVGTIKQISSLVNEVDGNGVKFADTAGAKIERLERGGAIKNKCHVGTEIQSVIFKKDKATLSEAKDWLREHDFKKVAVDEKENTYRFRQQRPSKFKHDSFRTIELTEGVEAVIACPIEKKEKGGTINDNCEAFETLFHFKF